MQNSISIYEMVTAGTTQLCILFVMTTLGGKLISIFKRAGKLFPAQTLINL